MKLQLTLGFILLLAIVGQFVETLDLFKFERPCKYYRGRTHRHRPRSSTSRRPSIYGHLKESESKHPHYYSRRPPSDFWHEPRHPENLIEKEPYTIEIEFPKRYKSSQRINDLHNRNYGLRAERDYHSDEEDYSEDVEDGVMQLVQMGLRIKAVKSNNPKFKIKVSREDTIENLVNPRKLIDAASNLRRNYPAVFLNNFNRESSQNRNSVYLVTKFPESLSGG